MYEKPSRIVHGYSPFQSRQDEGRCNSHRMEEWRVGHERDRQLRVQIPHIQCKSDCMYPDKEFYTEMQPLIFLGFALHPCVEVYLPVYLYPSTAPHSSNALNMQKIRTGLTAKNVCLTTPCAHPSLTGIFGSLCLLLHY